MTLDDDGNELILGVLNQHLAPGGVVGEKDDLAVVIRSAIRPHAFGLALRPPPCRPA
jgi:hypothetical protein